MKKDRILNPKLIELIATVGHTQSIVIADAGLPIPANVPVVDLSLVHGVPSLMQVLEAVCSELVVEGYCVASETAQKNPELELAMQNELKKLPVDKVSHEAFKERTKDALGIIRTGETTPYANVILYAGVNF